MPTKRTFDLVLMVCTGFAMAKGLVKLWATRTVAEPGDGPATRVAEAAMVSL